VHAVVARSAFPSQNVLKKHHVRTTFEGSDVVLRGKRKGFCTLPKVRNNLKVLWPLQKAMASVGRWKWICKD
jgi:hypothetical protein